MKKDEENEKLNGLLEILVREYIKKIDDLNQELAFYYIMLERAEINTAEVDECVDAVCLMMEDIANSEEEQDEKEILFEMLQGSNIGLDGLELMETIINIIAVKTQLADIEKRLCMWLQEVPNESEFDTPYIREIKNNFFPAENQIETSTQLIFM